MTDTLLRGRAHVYGHNVDTDAIIAGKYTKTLSLQSLADHVLEDLDPGFRNKVRPGDILVAGENFGCGSSREQAPLALKSAGVAAVIVNYCARIFFRNAINIGLPVLEVDRFEIVAGDLLEIDTRSGAVKNLTRETLFQANRMPQVMIDILTEGGLVNYLRRHGDYKTSR